MNTNIKSVTVHNFLESTTHLCPQTQEAMLKAGLQQGSRGQTSVAANRNINQNLWFQLIRSTKKTSVKTKLVSRKLTGAQRKHVLENERNSQVLEAYINHNSIGAKQGENLLKLRKPGVTIALGAKGLHEKLGRETMRKELYKFASDSRSSLIVGAINIDERSKHPRKTWENLESSTQTNIQRTFQMANTLLSTSFVLTGEEYNHLAVLLSSNPIYMQNLHLLKTSRQKQGSILKTLGRSILTEEVLKYIEEKSHLVSGTEQTAIQKLVASNPTRPSRDLTIGKLTLRADRRAVEGDSVYSTTNTQKLEKIQIKNKQSRTYNITHVACTLYVEALLKEKKKKGVQTQSLYFNERHVNFLNQNKLNFAWEEFKTRPRYNHRGYYRADLRNLDDIRKDTLQKLKEKTGTLFEDNHAAWQYWFGIGWNNDREAERNIDLALQLAKTEKHT